MQEEISTIILAALIGLFAGVAAGIGFSPIFPQPKNLKIQTVLSVIAIILMILLYLKIS